MLDNVIFRKDEIIKICCDKKVLHLGFIQHKLYEQKIKSNDWLHSKIAEVASSLVGFDYLQEDVEILKDKYGYIFEQSPLIICTYDWISLNTKINLILWCVEN